MIRESCSALVAMENMDLRKLKFDLRLKALTTM